MKNKEHHKTNVAGGIHQPIPPIVSVPPGQSLKNSTRLEPVNRTHSVVEGLQARVKDPLWLLGKQWQIGEFKARNGGHPVRSELNLKYKPLNNIAWKQEEGMNSASETFNLKIPLEMKVEQEAQVQEGKFKAKGWNSKRLEYGFSLMNGDTTLAAEEYDGENLDWYNFDLTAIGSFNNETKAIAVKPSPLSYTGMPLPRWWSIEDSRVDLGKIRRPHLNFLTMLLVEFSLIYSNDWYVIPLEHKIGNIRQIDKFVVIDSFGVVSEVNPVIDQTSDKQGWELFTHNSQLKSDLPSGRIFYLPNRLYHALESEPIEQVSLFRDEMANLVWAVEQKYQNKEEDIINRNDEELNNIPEPPKPSHYWDTLEKKLVNKSLIEGDEEAGKRYVGPVAKYLPKTHIPAHWIPYQPIQSDQEGSYVLRRSRTVEDLSQGPQYKGTFLSESKYIIESEVPRIGIKLNRVFQMARDSDGTRYIWRSRKKRPDVLHKSSGLRFDALIEK